MQNTVGVNLVANVNEFHVTYTIPNIRDIYEEEMYIVQ